MPNITKSEHRLFYSLPSHEDPLGFQPASQINVQEAEQARINQQLKETETVAPEEETFKQQKYKNTIKYCSSTEQFGGREL